MMAMLASRTQQAPWGVYERNTHMDSFKYNPGEEFHSPPTPPIHAPPGMLRLSLKKRALQNPSLNDSHRYDITVFAAATLAIQIANTRFLMKACSLSTCWAKLKSLCTYLPFLISPSLLHTNYPAFQVTLWSDTIYPLYDSRGVSQPSRF